MKLSKKDSRYIIASLVLLMIAGTAIGIFVKREINRVKYGAEKVLSDKDYALNEDENAETLEMDKLNSFGQQGKKEEKIVIESKEDASKVIDDMDEIIDSFEKDVLSETAAPPAQP
jgi:hypothetical protein